MHRPPSISFHLPNEETLFKSIIPVRPYVNSGYQGEIRSNVFQMLGEAGLEVEEPIETNLTTAEAVAALRRRYTDQALLIPYNPIKINGGQTDGVELLISITKRLIEHSFIRHAPIVMPASVHSYFGVTTAIKELPGDISGKVLTVAARRLEEPRGFAEITNDVRTHIEEHRRRLLDAF